MTKILFSALLLVCSIKNGAAFITPPQRGIHQVSTISSKDLSKERVAHPRAINFIRRSEKNDKLDDEVNAIIREAEEVLKKVDEVDDENTSGKKNIFRDNQIKDAAKSLLSKAKTKDIGAALSAETNKGNRNESSSEGKSGVNIKIPELPVIPKVFEKPKSSSSPSSSPSVNPIEVIVSSASGGTIGVIVGFCLTLYLLSDPFFDADLYLLPPATVGLVSAILSYTLSSKANFIGNFTRNILAGWYISLARDIAALPTTVATAAKEKVSETKREITSIPTKISDAAVKKQKEIVDEIKATPQKVKKSVDDKVQEVTKSVDDKVKEVTENIQSIPAKIIPAKIADSTLKTKQEIIEKIEPTPIKEEVEVTTTQQQEEETAVETKSTEEISEKEEGIPNIFKAVTPKISEALSSITTIPKDTEADEIRQDIQAVIADVASEEAATKRKMEAEAKEKAAAEAEDQRRLQAEARKKEAEEAAERKRLEAEARKKEAQEAAEQRRLEAEAKKKAAAEAAEQRRLEAEAKKKAEAEAAEQRRLEAEAKKKAAEEAKEQRRLEAEAKRLEAKEAAEQRRLEVEAKKKAAEDAAEQRRLEAEAKRKEAEEAAEQRRLEAEAKKQEAAEAAEQKRLEAEAKRKEAEEAAEQRRQELEARKAAAAEAAEKKRQELEAKKAAAAEAAEKRQQEIEAERAAAAEAAEKKRQELEAKKAAAAEAAEKLRMEQEAKKAAAAEAAEKRQQELEAKKAAAAAAAEAKRIKIETEKAAAAEAAEKAAAAAAAKAEKQRKLADSIKKSRQVRSTTQPIQVSSTIAIAGAGLPKLSKWKQNADNSISGIISRSKSYDDGEFITTSPIKGGKIGLEGGVVETGSGSKYFLEPKSQGGTFNLASIFGGTKESIPVEEKKAVTTKDSTPFSFLGGIAGNTPKAEKPGVASQTAEAKKAATLEAAARKKEEIEAKKAAAAEAKRKQIEAKKAAAEAKQKEIQAKKEAAAEAARKRREELEAKKAAAAEAKRKEIQAKKAAEKVLQVKKEAAAKAARKRLEKASTTVEKEDRKTQGFGLSSIFGGAKERTTPEVSDKPTTTSPPPASFFGGITGKTTQDSDSLAAAAAEKKAAAEKAAKDRRENIERRKLEAAAEAELKRRERAALKQMAQPGTGTRSLVDNTQRGTTIALSSNFKARSQTIAISTSGKTMDSAPPGVPTLSKWKMTKEGAVNGVISGASSYEDGERITTSKIANTGGAEIVGGMVVQTESGSRYFLEPKGESGGGTFDLLSIFGGNGPTRQVEESASTKVEDTSAQEKRLRDIEAKKMEAQAAAEKKRQETEAKKAKAAEAKRQQMEAQKAAAAEAAAKRKQEMEAKKTAAAEAKRKEMKAQKEAKRQQALAAAEAKRQEMEAKKRQAAQQSSTSSSPDTIVAKAPPGVPTLSRWKQNRNKSISGAIGQSKLFDDGEFITTSPIIEDAVEGTVVSTSSGSKYFLEPNRSATKSLFSFLGGGDDTKENDPPSSSSSPSPKVAANKQILEKVQRKRNTSTISIFGGGNRNDGDSASGTQAIKAPPSGVPSLVNWKRNASDGSITGRIKGSRDFSDGESITTSPIKKGNIASGEVVQTGSGSRYFLV